MTNFEHCHSINNIINSVYHPRTHKSLTMNTGFIILSKPVSLPHDLCNIAFFYSRYKDKTEQLLSRILYNLSINSRAVLWHISQLLNKIEKNGRFMSVSLFNFLPFQIRNVCQWSVLQPFAQFELGAFDLPVPQIADALTYLFTDNSKSLSWFQCIYSNFSLLLEIYFGKVK